MVPSDVDDAGQAVSSASPYPGNTPAAERLFSTRPVCSTLHPASNPCKTSVCSCAGQVACDSVRSKTAGRFSAFAKWSPITCKSCFAVNSVVRVLLDAGPQLVRASVPASGKSCPDAIAGMVQLGSVIVAAAVLWKFVEFSAKLRHCRSAESREFSGSCSCRCRLSDGCRSATVWSLAG